jgi:hypothetical protein
MKQLLALFALAGCATMTEPPDPTGPCQVSEQLRMRFIATEYRASMRDELTTSSNARVARIMTPDVAATMDFRADRLNIELDDQRRIAALRCG